MFTHSHKLKSQWLQNRVTIYFYSLALLNKLNKKIDNIILTLRLILHYNYWNFICYVKVRHLKKSLLI